jgi:hypothetical protein
MKMTDQVECTSGAFYAERPLALTWQGERYVISEILSQGRTPSSHWFRVRLASGQVFELTLDELPTHGDEQPVWSINPI